MELVTLPTPCGVCGSHESERVDSILVRCLGCRQHRPDSSPVPDEWGGYTYEGKCGTPDEHPLGMDGPQLVWADSPAQAAREFCPVFRWQTCWVRRRGTGEWAEYDGRGQAVVRQGALL